jgi:hypothetical protein
VYSVVSTAGVRGSRATGYQTTDIYLIGHVFNLRRNMEHRYSFEEYTDMHLMYGRAGGSRALARRLHQETFPNRRLPNEKTFQRADERLRETGTFEQSSVTRGRRRVARTVNKE